MGRRIPLAALLLLVAPAQAQAACAPGSSVFLSCQIDGSSKRLDICHDADDVTYRFGTEDAVELTLSVPVAQAAYTPWAGVGSSISEGITFQNGPFRYAVYGGIDRIADGDETRPDMFGGVAVLQDDKEIASLSCAPSTIVFPWNSSLWDAMHAAGAIWDRDARQWVRP